LHVLLTTLVLCSSSSFCAAQKQQQRAECQLVLRGYGSPSSSEEQDTRSSRQGIASARLDCSSTAGPVQIGINKQELQPYASAFTGVTVLGSSECQKHAAKGSRSIAINALLYFCSEQQLELQIVQPVIEGVALVNGSSKRVGADNKALLVFGGNVNATVTGGQFSYIQAGVALVVMNQAELTVHNTVVTSYKGNRARAAMAIDNSRVAIYNSTVSNMTGAGAVVARNDSRVSINGSTFNDNSYKALVASGSDQNGGGMLQCEDNSSAVVTQSQFIRCGTNGQQVSAVAVFNTAQVGASSAAQSSTKKAHKTGALGRI
jgi:hypothetical protein